MEGDTILLQDVFKHHPGPNGTTGDVVPTGLRPRFVERIAERGVELPAHVFRVARAVSGAPFASGKRAGAEAHRLDGPSLPGPGTEQRHPNEAAR